MEASVQPAAGSENGATGEESEGYAGTFAGQGDDSQGAGLYDLASAPPEVRPFLESELKKIEGNVTRKFQEHAEFREKYGPLAEVEGLADLDPETLSSLVAFHQVTQDPELFQQWLSEVGGDAGAGGELDEDGWLEMGIEKGWFDGADVPDGDEGGDGLDADAIRQQVLEEISPQLQAFQEWQAKQEEEEQVNEQQKALTERLEELTEQHGDALDVAEVLHLSHGYVAQGHEDPLGAAAEHYLRITGAAQGELVDEKLGVTDRVVSGGRDDTSPEGYGHDSPGLKKAALERLRA